jgi:DnaK suppressor protein
MDERRAQELLASERARLLGLLADERQAGAADRSAADEPGDFADPAEPLTDQARDDALIESIEDRLAAVERAEARLAAGTYGLSIRSGRPIPDDRLEADPAAELTVDEAAAE